MLIGYKRSQTSIILRVKILDSAQTDARGKTGLTSASAGLIISTIADTEATATAYTQAASNIETISTLGTYAAPTAGKCRFKEVDATNHKGVYEIQIADARFAVSGAKSLLVSISGASGVVETDVVVPLTDINFYDAVRAGLTALPNANAEAAGGLFTRGTGAGQINQDANGRIDANVAALSTDSTAADNAEALFDGTGYNASASNIGTVGTVNGLANGVITASKFGADALDSNALAASAATEIANAVKAIVVESNNSITLQQAVSVILAFAAGVTTDGGVTFKDPSGTNTRISGTVNGSNERTAVTVTPSA